jgi:lipoprotein NlpI
LQAYLFDFPISSYCQTAEDYFKSGLSKLRLEDHEGAIVEFTKAIQLKPNYVYAYSNRGVAKKNLDQKESGCLDLIQLLL